MSRRAVVSTIAVVLVVVAGVGLALFQPWRLVTTRTANEALLVPTSTTSQPATSQPTTTQQTAAEQAAPPAPSTPAPPKEPVALASGPFRSLEHATTGSATLVRLPDGAHAVQFEALDTSDGPDLYVYLSDKPSDSAEKAFGSGFTSLGKLKANQGNQVYDIPADANLTDVRSVVIWCQRFSAGFAVAPLEQA
ncbi:DM13 domain-containing protein [Umezawaea endophytica]|uniref:DM13 domain-containing protein n=1 Tax=Umezawaea endophytica TaxID=1654476 RepID=A0A9X2VKC6_9PSEU|nr:DM13 domain-containing protein [Umezawaea endophytica]MCS7478225.1 DM13 domain-containing protein [Umezawaea endophytica]